MGEQPFCGQSWRLRDTTTPLCRQRQPDFYPRPPQVRKFLKSMGMKCLKVGSLPSKADQDEQEDYKEKKL